MNRTARQFLPLTEATYVILAALTAPRHGYSIMQVAGEASNSAGKLGPGTLYTALAKLAEQGLIRRAGESGSNEERRKLYELTELGREVVELETARLSALAGWGRAQLQGKSS
ncbi:MAG: PadR family transcriptional regulator [Bryobacteraceae bacterium]|nr:PadR family transcriptional regulator [Bryobacteraceae bacterium]